MSTADLELFADYFQFYIQDEDAEGDLSSSWTTEALDRRLALAPGTVGVRTLRNSDVPVRLEFHHVEPPADFDAWDHVVECSIDVPSGRLVVAGCTDYFPEALRFEIGPGPWRVRVSYGGLDGHDHYRLQLWPGGARGVSIAKMGEPGDAPVDGPHEHAC